MSLKEGASMEFKSKVIDDIKRSVIAFANSGGGILYVGITDSGEVVGLTNADSDMMSINNLKLRSYPPPLKTSGFLR